jgi:hypothetical protein
MTDANEGGSKRKTEIGMGVPRIPLRHYHLWGGRR